MLSIRVTRNYHKTIKIIRVPDLRSTSAAAICYVSLKVVIYYDWTCDTHTICACAYGVIESIKNAHVFLLIICIQVTDLVHFAKNITVFGVKSFEIDDERAAIALDATPELPETSFEDER